MARLHLVRHGETEWNRLGRYQGHTDIPLNETGKAQARKTGEKLSRLSFSAVYASTLSRAIETAKLIAPNHPTSVVTHPHLIEGTLGPFEGIEIAKFRTEYAHILEKQQSLTNEEKLHFRFIEGMESGMDVVKRVEPVLIEIAEKHRDRDVLVVTHGGVIRALLVYLADHDWSTTRIQNGEVVTFLYEGGKLTLPN